MSRLGEGPLTHAIDDSLSIARVVARLAPPHERDEAVGEASLAITEAARRYEPGRGAWRTWAWLHAKWAVLRYLGRTRRLSFDEAQSEIADEQLDEGLLDVVCRLREAARVDGDVVRARLSGLTLRAAGQQLGCSRTQVLRRERRVLAALGGGR